MPWWLFAPHPRVRSDRGASGEARPLCSRVRTELDSAVWQGLGPETGLLCPHLAPKLGAATATPGHLEPADSAHGTRCQGRINPGVWAQSRQRGRAPLACPPPWRAGARFPGHSGVPTRAQGLCTPHAGQSKPTTQAPLETWGPSGGAPTGTTGGLGRENGTCQKKASGLQDITKTPPGARALSRALRADPLVSSFHPRHGGVSRATGRGRKATRSAAV